MMKAEVEFERELNVFGGEIDTAIRSLYCWRTVNLAARENTRLYNLLNRHALFFNTVVDALQTNFVIVLGRVFDDDKRSHSISRLLQIAEDNPSIFSKVALAERKRRGNANASDWLDEYMRKVYVPPPPIFKRIRRYVDVRRKIYESNYKKLRNKLEAHKDRINENDLQALIAKTNIPELERLLVFLLRLHEALWNLFHNGRKPTLRPMRYSAALIRKLPEGGAGQVQVEITQATERFLKAIVTESSS